MQLIRLLSRVLPLALLGCAPGTSVSDAGGDGGPTIDVDGGLVEDDAGMASVGCDGGSGTSREMQLSLESTPMEIDATTALEGLEDSLCSVSSSRDCRVVVALDRSDDDAVGDPPRIPDEFPLTVSVVDPVTNAVDSVDVEEWLLDVGAAEAVVPALVSILDPYDVACVASDEVVRTVSVETMGVRWQTNTLAFNYPQQELRVANDAGSLLMEPEAVAQPENSVPAGIVSGQPAASASGGFVSFVEGGVAAIENRLRGGAAVLVLSPSSSATSLELEVGSTPGLLKKPSGQAMVVITATVSLSVGSQTNDAGP